MSQYETVPSSMKLGFLLWLLYFLQGIPYGFQTKFLPIFLRDYSLSLTLISFTRLLSLPWLLKPLWAPLVDRYGTKMLWVQYNLIGMALSYLATSCMSLNGVSFAVFIVPCLNVMAATQDIAVDALFVDNLSREEIGEFFYSTSFNFIVGFQNNPTLLSTLNFILCKSFERTRLKKMVNHVWQGCNASLEVIFSILFSRLFGQFPLVCQVSFPLKKLRWVWLWNLLLDGFWFDEFLKFKHEYLKNFSQ